MNPSVTLQEDDRMVEGMHLADHVLASFFVLIYALKIAILANKKQFYFWGWLMPS